MTVVPKVLPPLQVGTPVRIQQGRIWTPAFVLEKHETPRTFKVKTEDGQVYRRNRKFLNLCQSFESQPNQVVQAAPPASVPLQKQFHLRQQPLNLWSLRSPCLKFP